MSTATLLVVDMLNDFFEREPVPAAARGRLVAAINELASGFRERGLPVVWVRQEFAPDLHDAFLDMRTRNVMITIAGTPGCEILPELERAAGETTIVKKRYSAFFGTDLDETLARNRPDWFVVAGVNTHACIRTTVVDAYQRDFRVVVAADCVSSYDAEHAAITKRYLDGKIASFRSNPEIFNMLDAEDV